MTWPLPFSSGIGPNGTATSVLSDDICNQWRDWRVWTDEQKQEVKTLVLDEMDALQSFFFWTWRCARCLNLLTASPAQLLTLILPSVPLRRIGESRVLGYASAAEWHYQVRPRRASPSRSRRRRADLPSPPLARPQGGLDPCRPA